MTTIQPTFNESPHTTEEQCLEFVRQWHQYGQEQGFQLMEPETFWQPGDLERYRQTVAWWPKDAPPIVGQPWLASMLKGVAVFGREPEPFTQTLTFLWKRCYDWLVAEERDPKNPNESKEARRRRMAKERVARSREFNAKPNTEHVRQLHREYIAACQARKAAVDATHAAHTPAVEAAHAAWQEARASLA